MNFVENLEMFGVPAKEIPCLVGSGPPSAATAGGVGSLYMDSSTGIVYKCIGAVGTVYTWDLLVKDNGSDSSQNVDLTGYAKETWVQEGFQPKGDYLTGTELTNAVNTALAQAKASGEFDGADGKDGSDYVLTEADKSEIAAMVIEMLGGNPVFGYVDENNNIIVSGNLTDGTYSVKYEMADGSTIDIGDLTLESGETVVPEPVTENIALTKDLAISATTGEDRPDIAGFCATAHIDVTNVPKPCVIHLAEAKWANSEASETSYVRTYITDKAGNKLVGDYTHSSKMPSGVVMVLNDDKVDDVTVTVTSDNIGTIRFSGMYTYGNVDDFANTIATLTYTPES